MAFTSVPFILFCLATLLLFNQLKPDKKTILIALSSLVFYAYLNFFSCLVLLLVILIVYTAVQLHINIAIPCAIISLLGILALMRLMPNVRGYLWLEPSLNPYYYFIIPIGISFYTLQAVGYLLDIKDKKAHPEKSLIKTIAFLSFFPQSLSGPIHRANELMPQLNTMAGANTAMTVAGGKKILWGYFCKLIIADKLALIINPIFSDIPHQDGLTLLFASALYSFQLYFDFYGYTLIAIGIACLFGVRFTSNFNSPYSVSSFKAFWRRWHISLSRWLRDYVYLKLGGRNQSNYIKFIIVILITFLVSALWHGGKLNFLLWGFFHAVFYITEDLIEKVPIFRSIKSSVFIHISKKIIFFLMITFTWIVFRSADLAELVEILEKIITIRDWSINAVVHLFVKSIYFGFLLLTIVLIIVGADDKVPNAIEKNPISFKDKGLEMASIVSCLLLIIIFGDVGVQEFLYFNF